MWKQSNRKQGWENKKDFQESTFVSLVVGFSFTIQEFDGQFQWGVNHRLEALKLKQMLSDLKPPSGIQTSPTVESHFTLSSLDFILNRFNRRIIKILFCVCFSYFLISFYCFQK